ncbi:MAG: TetR family transcriptional regulator [Betaproteobacteria bacterium]|nr:TetR family transcriptional regulator [Betaproteobacteria bacterium]
MSVSASPRPAAPKRRQFALARDRGDNRAGILAAATAEFARHGLAGARVDRIAAAAGTNKRMLYYYFGNKEALFSAVLEAAYADIRAAETGLSLQDVPPIEGIRRLIAFTWDYFIAHPEFLMLLNTENLYGAQHLKGRAQVRTLNSPLIATLRAILRRGRADGTFRADPDALQLYISIAALAYFYLSNNHTLSAIFARDLSRPAARRARLAHMTDLVVGYLRHGAD